MSEDVQGYIAAPEIALSDPWTNFICGNRAGSPHAETSKSTSIHSRNRGQLPASPGKPSTGPLLRALRKNAWGAVKAHRRVTERAAATVIAKYNGVLAAADIEIFTRTTTSPYASCASTKAPAGPVHP